MAVAIVVALATAAVTATLETATPATAATTITFLFQVLLLVLFFDASDCTSGTVLVVAVFVIGSSGNAVSVVVSVEIIADAKKRRCRVGVSKRKCS